MSGKTKAQEQKSLVKNTTALLDTLLDNYDQKFRPGHGKAPLFVMIHITVLSMGPISEKDFEFTMDCYFRQIWIDERLKFSGPLKNLSLASKFCPEMDCSRYYDKTRVCQSVCRKNTSLCDDYWTWFQVIEEPYPQVLKDIWRPDTYIKNGRQSYLHTITMPNVLLRVFDSGEVYVSQRLTIRSRCPMFLRKFPMDTQACPVFIGSLGYSSDEIIYVWKKLSVKPGINLAQYKLIKAVKNAVNMTDPRSKNESLSTLQAYFILQRQQGFYVLQMYIPCTLLVIMSWVSFWLNKEASPARVSLGIMTVLSMSTLSLGGRDGLPRIGYSTALDIFVIVCFVFVFLALVEYAVINFAHMIYVQKSIHQMCSFGAVMLANNKEEETRALKDSSPMDVSTSEAIELSPEKPMWERIRDTVFCRNRAPRQSGLARMMGQPKIKSGRPSFYRNWKDKAKQRLRESDPSVMVDKVDTISKFLFPGMYILFNLFYWFAYFYWIPNEIDTIPAVSGDNELSPE